jgi:hypothetical protein
MDCTAAIAAPSHATAVAPPPLRWSLLSVACELADPKSADYLLRTAMAGLPAPGSDGDPGEQWRSELLIRVLAVEALYAIASRHPECRRHIVTLIASRPAPPVMYEALRAARQLALDDVVGEARLGIGA